MSLDRVKNVYEWLKQHEGMFASMESSEIAATVVSMFLETPDSAPEAELAKSEAVDPVKAYFDMFIDDTSLITPTHENVVRFDVVQSRGVIAEVYVPGDRNINLKNFQADEVTLCHRGGSPKITLVYCFSKCEKEQKLLYLAHEKFFNVLKKSYAEQVMLWTRANVAIKVDEFVKQFPIFKNNFRFLGDKTSNERFIQIWKFFQN